jgi:uncharacterized membrane protein
VFLIVLLSLTVLCLLAAVALSVAKRLHLGLLGAAGLVVVGLMVLVLLFQLGNMIRWVRERSKRQG